MIDMRFFDEMKGEARAKRKSGLTNQELLNAMEANIDEVIDYLHNMIPMTHRDDYELRSDIRKEEVKLMECMNLVDMLRRRNI